jgi:glycine/D-amino acid oxidase-like deaminating enzyme
MDRIQTLVLGAGVVGLAVARQLALEGREVLLLEAADAFGTGTSSRNSAPSKLNFAYMAENCCTAIAKNATYPTNSAVN